MNAEETKAWLTGLKPGDKVYVAQVNSVGSIQTITRVSQFSIYIGGTKYSRMDGHQRTNSMFGSHIMPVTVEHAEKILHAKLVYRLRNYPFAKLPLDTLRAIDALLPEQEARDE